jgi:hypothetical protein
VLLQKVFRVQQSQRMSVQQDRVILEDRTPATIQRWLSSG